MVNVGTFEKTTKINSVGGIDGLDKFLLSSGAKDETMKDKLANALKEANDVKEIDLSPSKKI